ncbi:MAG: ACP S-malonyltransferase [Pseudomonadales bacterium]|nr:ACP S-malonyltransferase [Pseudomonadales bacterium]
MTTFIFPGQGSQSKGMGGALFDEFSEQTKQANDILGYSIKELCLKDSKRELNKTQFTQPALYVVNALSYFKKIADGGNKPNYVAGHSLGEFNALLAAECFDFETGLKLVKKRGDLMSQSMGGGMAAILNSSQEEIETLLDLNGLKNIDIANYNTPSQIVISGLREEIAQAQMLFEEGDALYYPLNTSGAFHSRYMLASREEFEAYLKKFTFSDSQIPVISNVSAKPYQAGEVMMGLTNQLISPVKWSESIQYLLGVGETVFEEIGHGEVLTKLVSKIKKELPKINIPTEVVTQPNAVEKVRSVQSVATGTTEIGKASSGLDNITGSLTAVEKVNQWNQKNPIGTRVQSEIVKDKDLQTRTEAVVLFKHRAAVYLKGYNGYFDLDETVAI